MPHRAVCTVVARNYVPHARVLARSLEQHCPGVPLYVLVLDGKADADDLLELSPTDVGFQPKAFQRMAAIYDVLELATAVKARLLGALLDRGFETAMFLDPDVMLFASIEGAFEAVTSASLLFTPHTLNPVPDDGLYPTEVDLSWCGRFNLGFIAVTEKARPFLRWWEDHLARSSLRAPQHGIFVDQVWAEIGSGYFDHDLLLDPGYNVAYWNVHERPLRRQSGGLTAGEAPLRFFHFSGFDPRLPAQLSIHQRGRPRVIPTRGTPLGYICNKYADALIDAGFDSHVTVPYGYGRSLNGDVLDLTLRRRYRNDLLRAERDGRDLPSPFDPCDVDAWAAWHRRASARGAAHRLGQASVAGGIHRSLRRLNVSPTTIARLAGIRNRLISATAAASHASPGRTGGVNLVGYLRAENGVGEIARLIGNSLNAGGVEHSLINISATVSRQEHSLIESRQGAEFDTNIVCVNADMFPSVAALHPGVFNGRKTIGVWAWETDHFPDNMAASAGLLDEVWVYSHHAAAAVAPKVEVPVLVLPVPTDAYDVGPLCRSDLDLPEGFLFLFCFDYLSVFERKNPLGLIAAYRKAFPSPGDVRLVIKSINAEYDPANHRRLQAATAGRTDIQIRDGYLPAASQRSLVSLADAYVSLHRAEGFGLTLAEAMAMGIPTVATGYSGNLEYMTPWNSFLVPFGRIPIAEGADPYVLPGTWAEPNVAEAACLLRRVVASPEEAAHVAAQGQATVRSRTIQVTGSFVAERLNRLREVTV